MILSLLADSRPLFYQQAILIPADTRAGGQFAQSSALDHTGDKVVVGAPFGKVGAAPVSGRAYSAIRTSTTGWSSLVDIPQPVLIGESQFGYSVALSADGMYCAVGAPKEHFLGEGKVSVGAVYIYTWVGAAWVFQEKLVATDRSSNDYFGWSVSLSADGTTCAIGSYLDDSPSAVLDSGSVYVFTRSGATWTQAARLQTSTLEAGANLGYAVDISDDGTTIAAGAWQKDTTATDAGAVFVFTKSGSWSTVDEQTLTAVDAGISDRLGSSVSLSEDGNFLVAGSFQDDTVSGLNTGSAYVYSRSGLSWTPQTKLVANDALANQAFGTSVAMSASGRVCAVGAPGSTVSGAANSGAFYVFTRLGSAWTQVSKQAANDRSAQDFLGSSLALSGTGKTCVAGANNGVTTAGNAGKAYVFLW